MGGFIFGDSRLCFHIGNFVVGIPGCRPSLFYVGVCVGRVLGIIALRIMCGLLLKGSVFTESGFTKSSKVSNLFQGIFLRAS